MEYKSKSVQSSASSSKRLRNVDKKNLLKNDSQLLDSNISKTFNRTTNYATPHNLKNPKNLLTNATSTPAENNFAAQFNNISAITISDNSKNFRQENSLTKVFKDEELAKSSGSFKEEKSEQILYDDKICEAELDLYYSQYLQAVFLYSKMKKTIELKAAYALDQLYKLWFLIQGLKLNDYSLNKELDALSYLAKLKKKINEQENILPSFIENSYAFLKYYRKIAETINNLRYKLIIQETILPSSSEFQEKFLKCIEELKLLMENSLISFNQEKIISSANKFSTFVSESKSVIQELERCSELLLSTHDALLSETSLTLGDEDLKNCMNE